VLVLLGAFAPWALLRLLPVTELAGHAVGPLRAEARAARMSAEEGAYAWAGAGADWAGGVTAAMRRDADRIDGVDRWPAAEDPSGERPGSETVAPAGEPVEGDTGPAAGGALDVPGPESPAAAESPAGPAAPDSPDSAAAPESLAPPAAPTNPPTPPEPAPPEPAPPRPAPPDPATPPDPTPPPAPDWTLTFTTTPEQFTAPLAFEAEASAGQEPEPEPHADHVP
jgi:hypothetical protein